MGTTSALRYRHDFDPTATCQGRRPDTAVKIATQAQVLAVPAWETLTAGLVVITLRRTYPDAPGASVTHAPSGMAVVQTCCPDDAAWIAGRLGTLGVDWTVADDVLLARYGQDLELPRQVQRVRSIERDVCACAEEDHL